MKDVGPYVPFLLAATGMLRVSKATVVDTKDAVDYTYRMFAHEDDPRLDVDDLNEFLAILERLSVTLHLCSSLMDDLALMVSRELGVEVKDARRTDD